MVTEAQERAALLAEIEASKAYEAALAADNARRMKEREAKRKERQERAKRSDGLLDFIHLQNPRYQAGWVHRDICRRLERFSAAVTAQQSPRLMLFMPPRHGKSEIGSRNFPTWHIGRNPSHEVILTSYGADLAATMSLAGRTVATNSAEWWPALSPGPRWTNDLWIVPGGGGVRAAGVGGSIMGQGAHLAIIDDPIKDAKEAASPTIRNGMREWYQSTLYTRLAPGGGVLVIMTRWTEDDLAGWLLEQEQQGGDKWEVVRYPAIAEEDEPHRKIGEALHPERRDIAALLQIKANVSPYWWAALYQQRPSPAEGSIFRRAWMQQRWDALPTLDDQVISCDLTFKDTKGADYVVMQVWGRKGADRYLIDQVRDRLDYPATKQALRDLRAKHPKVSAVLVEDKANGPALVSELKKEIPGLIAWDPGKNSKAERAQVLSVPSYAAGQVYLPTAAWTLDFIEEHVGFGAGAANDDQVDAESQAFGWWASRTTKASKASFGWLPVDGAPSSW